LYHYKFLFQGKEQKYKNISLPDILDTSSECDFTGRWKGKRG